MSVQFYPVIPTMPDCDDYRVKINGQEVSLNTARVSAVPHNRRWPGHQRQIEQTEAIQFLSMATDEPLQFEITPKDAFESVKIRPQSLGITPEIKDGRILFTLNEPAYFTVEPYGRNRALHVFADPIPSYEIDRDAPDLLYFGAGEHDVGTIELKSNQTLFLDEGAVVYACVHAMDAENIKILGRGILDNRKNKEKILFAVNAEDNQADVGNAERKHTLELEYCSNIEIDGITIRDSLVYNIRPIACDHLRIRHVKIIGCWRYNSDGIDMHNCTNVHISDCFIRTFDDSICAKGFDCYYKGDLDRAVHDMTYRNGKVYDTFKNLLVENCVIWNDWGKCLEIGAETRAEEICSITFRNCDLIHLTGTVLDCMNVDYADVHDVRFLNINVEADEVIPKPVIQKSDAEVYVNPDPNYMPITVCAEVIFHHEYSAGGTRRGRNRDLTFKNINVIGDRLPKARFGGYDETHKTENVSISNLCLNGNPISDLTGENWQIKPFAENIRLTVDPYAQMEKNTVDSEGQLKESQFVQFHNPNGTGVRVMFVGNSITLHGILPQIGWYGDWGMAASEKNKDYVHLLENEIKKTDPNAAFCVCQVAEWERLYQNKGETLQLFRAAREFGADVIIFRFVENVKKDSFDSQTFRREYDLLAKYLDKTGHARFLLSTGFWHHPADGDILAYARENGLPCVELGDLGEDDSMKAIGLFSHRGVANHPGDAGMQKIAERIMESLLQNRLLEGPRA